MIVVLIILAIVSLLGVAGSRLVLMAERSSRFDRDWQIAFQAAEAALIDAEFDIRGPNTSAAKRVANFSPTSVLGFADGCGTGADRGLCIPGAKPIWYTVDFTDDNVATARTVGFGDFTGRTFSTGDTGIRPEKVPRYIIEFIPDRTPGYGVGSHILYRVTAMGFGPKTETQAVIQMVFRKE